MFYGFTPNESFSITDLVKAETNECYYESLLNSFGTSPKDAAMCLSPDQSECSYKSFCVKSATVEIKIRHCGSFYVYYLKPVRKINRHKFFENPKSGLYCGTEKKEMVKPSGEISLIFITQRKSTPCLGYPF